MNIILLVLFYGSAMADPTPQSLTEKTLALHQTIDRTIEASTHERNFDYVGTEIDRYFESTLGLEEVNWASTQPDDDLTLQLFWGIVDAALYADCGVCIEYLEILAPRVSHSDFGGGEAIRSFVDVFVSKGRFSDAETLATSFASENSELRNRIPRFVSDAPEALSSGRQLAISTTETGLFDRGYFEFDGFTGVIMIGHPECHFSRSFFEALEDDPQLKTKLVKDTYFLMSGWQAYNNPAIPFWNTNHPEYAFTIAIDETEWSEINYWGTPTFYFFREGDLQKKVVGWRQTEAEQQKTKLWAGLDMISDHE